MPKLIDIEGVGTSYAQKLNAAGIRTTDDLLEKGGSTKGRKEIAETAGVSEQKILEWVNHVDLFRINGVGEEYADLLEAAGVDTVPELAQRNAQSLHQKLLAINTEKNLTRQPPSEKMVSDWIEQAKKLPRMINY